LKEEHDVRLAKGEVAADGDGKEWSDWLAMQD
jgi:hypothetical protein